MHVTQPAFTIRAVMQLDRQEEAFKLEQQHQRIQAAQKSLSPLPTPRIIDAKQLCMDWRYVLCRAMGTVG